MPYKEGGVFLHAATMFHIVDAPVRGDGAAPARSIPSSVPQHFCEAVERDRVTHTVLVPTMINMLTQFPDLTKYDLATLERVAYGGSPMPPELINHTREVLPRVKLVRGYGLSPGRAS